MTFSESLYYADVVASSIYGTVTIAHKLKGSIIAFGENGSIDAVRIGRDPSAADDRGFGGSDVPPLDQIETVSGQPWYFTPFGPGPVAQTYYEHTLGSLIKAKTIGVLDMYSMGKTTGCGFGEPKAYAPTVEVEAVGELLLERFGHGAIWSGIVENWEQLGSGCWVPVNENKSDDYAVVGILRVGCMSRQAQLWFTDLERQVPAGDPENKGDTEFGDLRAIGGAVEDRLSEPGHISGSIHVPSWPNGYPMRLWGGLVNDENPDECFCQEPGLCPLGGAGGGGSVCIFETVENDPDGCENTTPRWTSPRFPRPFDDLPDDLGIIQVAGSLGGAIVLDAANQTGAARDNQWTGQVRVLDSTTTPIILSPDSTGLDIAPRYDRLPADLGGGCVGLAPAQVHLASTAALNTTEDGITNTEFNDSSCDPQPGLVDFYLPVSIPSTFQPPVIVWLLTPSLTTDVDVSRFLNYAVPGAFDHTLRFRAAEGSGLPAGAYDVSQLGGSYLFWLRSAYLTTPSDVDPFGFVRRDVPFDILLDCPFGAPCVLDDTGCDSVPSVFCDPIDFNNDGLFPDTVDIDDFLSVFAGGPCTNDPFCNDIDYNNDGLFPDTLDIDALVSVFSGGPCLR